jgi:hypothetical protein
MAKTFTVHVTVPNGYMVEQDGPVVEEMIAAAVANVAGEELAAEYDGDEYDASIDYSTWGE